MRAGAATRVGSASALVAALSFLSACRSTPPPKYCGTPPMTPVHVDLNVKFKGWDALALDNGNLRVVVVPAIGRVMGLGFTGDPAGAADPLWIHPAAGKDLRPDENGWINYGGDKAWPAPQSEWQRIVGKGWPPPATFDAQPYTTTVTQQEIEMVSAVDPAYGLRMRRKLQLVNDVLMIDTTYEKVDGPSVRVAVWTITQLASPERMFAPLPSDASTYATLMPAQPRDLRVDDFHLSLARHTTEKTMIATNARSLAWIGAGRNLVITNVATYFDSGGGSAPLGRNAPHAGNTNAQIYTSPDGAEPYVELELLSPLVDLAPGQRVTMAVRYWLARREKADPDEEARRLFTDPRGAAPRR